MTDGTYFVITFSCPCTSKVGDELDFPLTGFRTVNINRLLPQDVYAKRNPELGSFDQEVVAQVVDCKKGIAAIGGISISIGSPFPSNIIDGDFVGFSVTRLDLD